MSRERALTFQTQIFGASFSSDGEQDSGLSQSHPQQVHSRHLHLHRPHERSQLWQVSTSMYIIYISQWFSAILYVSVSLIQIDAQ